MDDTMNGGAMDHYENHDAPVQASNPMELMIGRDVLLKILADSVASIRLNRLPRAFERPEETELYDLMIAQRNALSEWVANYPGHSKNIYVGLYIASEFESPEDEDDNPYDE